MISAKVGRFVARLPLDVAPAAGRGVAGRFATAKQCIHSHPQVCPGCLNPASSPQVEGAGGLGGPDARSQPDVQFPWESMPLRQHAAHVIDIEAFRIDTYPVTNRRYHAFLQQSGWRPTSAVTSQIGCVLRNLQEMVEVDITFLSATKHKM